MQTLVALSVLALVVLFLGLYKQVKWLLPVSVTGLLAAFILNVKDWNTELYYYNQMMHYDNFAVAFAGLTIFSTLLVFLLSKEYFEKISENIAEYYSVMLFALVGVIGMVSYHNLAMLFIGIETLSVSLYVLAGIRKKDAASNEAALKYFLMGAFATGFLLFGIALVYGATGSFDIEAIGNAVRGANYQFSPVLVAGILMMMVGLAFKVSAAPFHFWTPDVYEGAPTLITAFMSTVVKTAGFAAFLRLFITAFAGAIDEWSPALAIICALTLIVGNITAVYQTGFKRMMAYSSISHAGYMLLAILALGELSAQAVFIYAAAYSVASILAFGVLIRVKELKGNDDFESFNGLAKSNPFLAFILTVAMCSLAGIPLTAGFFGKFFIFSNALSHHLLWLVIVAILAAVVGIYYYFRVVIAMYMKEAASEEQVLLNSTYKVVLAFAALATIIIGLFPGLITGIL